ncbi:MFS transporter [Pelagicoccus mobilis]|uniref:MFS transporter n=1 Tax=Pelagicoccus mobilis TaxID=415221 RepID=A0A934S166_9BACT|nr:MFS transporter [Pelagicoccus mobilis]MBK1877218.1 MFS transporter [Pelagicoccus mobilis]
MATSKSNTAPLSFVEKLGYGSGDMASNFYMTFFNIFLLYYYVDVWGISPAGAATMFLVTKVIDAVSDPAMGLIADRTNTRWGKYRPFLLWVALPYALLGYLLFLGPELSGAGKLVFAYVSYSLVMLAYTAINVPYSALLAVISPVSEERTKATQFRFVSAALGTLVVGACAKPLVAFLGGGDEVLGFRLTIILFAILSMALFFFTFAATRERISPRENKSSIKGDFAILKNNTSWIILALCSVISIVGFVARISSTAFYTKYNMGLVDEKVLWWMDGTSLIFSTGTVAQLFGALLTPYVLKLVDKKILMILVNTLFGVSVVLTYFVPVEQYALTLVVYTVGLFCFGLIITLLFVMYTDCSEYGEWISGRNIAALTVSASMFAIKFGSAVGSAIPGYILDIAGFVKGQEQTPGALQGISFMWSIVPSVFFFAAAGLMIFYKLDSKTMEKIEKEMLDRRGETL